MNQQVQKGSPVSRTHVGFFPGSIPGGCDLTSGSSTPNLQSENIHFKPYPEELLEEFQQAVAGVALSMIGDGGSWFCHLSLVNQFAIPYWVLLESR